LVYCANDGDTGWISVWLTAGAARRHEAGRAGMRCTK
jgi:hypothetical protein